MERVACDARGVGIAVNTLRGGGIVAYPTDTVYGIGCDPYDAAAVRRIYRIKGRDPAKPLPVLARSLRDVSEVARVTPAAGRLAAALWPGRLTIILRLEDRALGDSMGLGDTLAVRVPGGACAQAILSEFPYLVGTSANLSGQAPAQSPEDLQGIECDVLVDGGRTGGGESTLVDASGETVRQLRAGAVPFGEVAALL